MEIFLIKKQYVAPFEERNLQIKYFIKLNNSQLVRVRRRKIFTYLGTLNTSLLNYRWLVRPILINIRN